MKNTDTINYSKYDLLVMKAEAIRSVADVLTSYVESIDSDIDGYEKDLQLMEENGEVKTEWGNFEWRYESTHRNLENAKQKRAVWNKLVDTLDKMM